MAVLASTDERNAIAEIAESWIGVPYHHQGRTRIGCDCIGLLIGVWCEWSGEDAPEAVVYAPDWHIKTPDLLHNSVSSYMHEVEDHGPGDVLLFTVGSSRLPRHTGIVSTDPSRIVHAYSLRSMNKAGQTVKKTTYQSFDLHSAWRAEAI